MVGTNVGRIAVLLMGGIAAGLASGCGSSSKAAGTAGGPCYGNATCNTGLTCRSSLCVTPNASGGTGGGAAGAGGTGGAGAAGMNGAGGGAAGAGACSGLSVPAQSCLSVTLTEKVNNEVDLLFMIDNSSAMTEMQQKLFDQLPSFVNVLQSGLTPLSLHVAVVSSDLGAPSDSAIGCTSQGDQGKFHYLPEGSCTSTTLQTGATFISDANMTPNYTDPSLASVFQCIALLGAQGCGFTHQLASIDRALGADGSPAPSTNANFLRPEAYLGVVILTNEDDCSAPANTTIYSLNGSQQNLLNPDGPLAKYRCNGGPRGGHSCEDPNDGNALIVPPLRPPSDAQGSATMPTLDLAGCRDNETGTSALTPVSQFVSDIKALKPDPDNQILVAAIAGSSAPYTVAWVPETGGQNTQPGELWPEVEHVCGAQGGNDVNPLAAQFTTDGSFADPGVRITQFVSSFYDSVLASICDPSYAATMSLIATKIGQLINPPCITGKIQNDLNGNPNCRVVENVENNNVYQSSPLPDCNANGNTPPCWQLLPSNTTNCSGQSLQVNDTPQNATAQNVTFSVNCSVCVPNSVQPGC